MQISPTDASERGCLSLQTCLIWAFPVLSLSWQSCCTGISLHSPPKKEPTNQRVTFRVKTTRDTFSDVSVSSWGEHQEEPRAIFILPQLFLKGYANQTYEVALKQSFSPNHHSWRETNPGAPLLQVLWNKKNKIMRFHRKARNLSCWALVKAYLTSHPSCCPFLSVQGLLRVT